MSAAASVFVTLTYDCLNLSPGEPSSSCSDNWSTFDTGRILHNDTKATDINQPAPSRMGLWQSPISLSLSCHLCHQKSEDGAVIPVERTAKASGEGKPWVMISVGVQLGGNEN